MYYINPEKVSFPGFPTQRGEKLSFDFGQVYPYTESLSLA